VRLDLAQDFALVAKQDNAPAALHPAGEPHPEASDLDPNEQPQAALDR
jgi:hypothetical protein